MSHEFSGFLRNAGPRFNNDSAIAAGDPDLSKLDDLAAQVLADAFLLRAAGDIEAGQTTIEAVLEPLSNEEIELVLENTSIVIP